MTFVDLDGTLVAANSMHIFMRKLPGLLLRRRAVGASIGALRLIGLRSLKLVNHRSMKWHLTKYARRHLLDSDWQLIAEEIARRINYKVKATIESKREKGCLTFIASAALEEYTLPLCRLLGYDGVIATKFTDSMDEYEEMNRYAKHDAIEHLLQDENLRLESFITDHTDDIPTAAVYPGLTIIVNPSKKTADEFRQVGVTRYIIA